MNHTRLRAGWIRQPALALAMGLSTALLGACTPVGLRALSSGGLPAIAISGGGVTDSDVSESGQAADRSSQDTVRLDMTRQDGSRMDGSRQDGSRQDAGQQAGNHQPVPDLRTASTTLEPVGAGILAKNSSKFAGVIMAPAGILAKNSSKYQVASVAETPFAQVPFGQGLVVLMTPDGLYYLDGQDQPITATTDDLGRYDFGEFRIPTGKPVLVSASFPGNRVLYQYALSAAGDNHVDVDAAGTFVSAYLVAQSRRMDRPLESFDASRLPGLNGLTRAMLDDGSLPFDPDLFTLPRSGDLVASYRSAFLGRSPNLAAAWAALLGPDGI